MALVNLPAASLRFEYKDASGSNGATIVHVPWATSTTLAIAAADAISAAMTALSDAVIIGYSLTYSKFDDAPGTAVAGSRVEEKGEFVWRQANARLTRFSIPAIKDTLLNPSGSVDQTDALVIALIDAVTAGGVIFCGADGADISSLFEAYQRFNSSTKRQLPGDR